MFYKIIFIYSVLFLIILYICIIIFLKQPLETQIKTIQNN